MYFLHYHLDFWLPSMKAGKMTNYGSNTRRLIEGRPIGGARGCLAALLVKQKREVLALAIFQREERLHGALIVIDLGLNHLVDVEPEGSLFLE